MTRLVLSEVEAGYDRHPVVRPFDLSVDSGEIVALLGPNGAGKTTLLLTLAGLLPRLGGKVMLDGEVLPGSAAGINRRGVVLVPDDRSLFRSLTVAENLNLARRRGGPGTEKVVDLFPELLPRLNVLAGALSGGEQQMLAIGRALVQEPRVLLIDELSMGLAPIIVDRILKVLRSVADTDDVSIVLVEQYVRPALATSDSAVVLVRGRVEVRSPSDALLSDLRPLEEAYLS